MRFVVSRGDTNNPEFLGIVIPPSTPGFKHVRMFPKGFRFEVIDPEHIRRVKEGQFAIEDDGSPRSTAEIAKIDAEVAKDIERQKQEAIALKRSKREAWTRGHKLQVIAIVVGVVMVILGWMLFANRAMKNTPSTSGAARSTNSAPQTAP
jgi:hypothetical protein